MEFKLLKYLAGFFRGGFDKERIVEDMRVTLAELDNVVIPAYEAAATHFKASKIKSTEIKNLSGVFYQSFDSHGRSRAPNFISDILQQLRNVRGNLSAVSDVLNEILEKNVIIDGITARKAVLIRASESINFASRYALDLLDYVYITEHNSVSGGGSEASTTTPAAVRDVKVRLNQFATSISDYGIPTATFIKEINLIPEVVVNKFTQDKAGGSIKESTIDPFANAHMSNFMLNPIYRIRLFPAEWQVNRYNASKEKKKVLELRLLYLNMANEKKQDAAVEKEIIYLQNRIDKLDAKIRDVEESILSSGE